MSVVRKKTENESWSVGKSKQNALMLLSNCAVYAKKKPSFIKNQALH